MTRYPETPDGGEADIVRPSELVDYVRGYMLAQYVLQFLLHNKNLPHQGATIGNGIALQGNPVYQTQRVVLCCEKLARLGGLVRIDNTPDKPSFACTEIGRQVIADIQQTIGSPQAQIDRARPKE